MRLILTNSDTHKYQITTTHVFTTGLLISFMSTALLARPVSAFEGFLSTPLTFTAIASAVTPTTLGNDTQETSLERVNAPRTGAVVASALPVTSTSVAPPAKKKSVPVSPKLLPGETIVMEGEASYYSRAGCLGCSPLLTMANGQPLDDNALTMAIGADKKHLVGYQAKVTNLATGASVIVKITDTGGFYQEKYGNRVADLTIASKEAIGIRGGLGKVRVEVF